MYYWYLIHASACYMLPKVELRFPSCISFVYIYIYIYIERERETISFFLLERIAKLSKIITGVVL